MKSRTRIWCVSCDKKVSAVLVGGGECYPHRPDLKGEKFWKCPICGNFVGTHKGTEKPLGVIAHKHLKMLRNTLHDIIDPIWRNKIMTRSQIYKYLSKELGYEFHTAETKTADEVYQAIAIANQLKERLE